MAKWPMDDIREIPVYGMPDVSNYLDLPRTTVEYWISGKDPIVQLPSVNPPRFSFNNLVEMHILSIVRTKGVKLKRVRNALWSMRAQNPRSRHPLLEHRLLTDGVYLFSKSLEGVLVNESKGGQSAFREMLELYLERIERDWKHAPLILYPFLREKSKTEPRIIQINPRVGFGRPVIAGTSITTAVIASRFNARESVADLAEEYERTPAEIEEAIRWEKIKAA